MRIAIVDDDNNFIKVIIHLLSACLVGVIVTLHILIMKLFKFFHVLKNLINEKLHAIDALKAKSKTEKVSEKPKTKPSLK